MGPAYLLVDKGGLLLIASAEGEHNIGLCGLNESGV